LTAADKLATVTLMESNQHKAYHFFLTSGNQDNCWVDDICRGELLAVCYERKVAPSGRDWARTVTMVHRATKGNVEAAKAVEGRLVHSPAVARGGYTVLTTEHWDVVETGEWRRVG